MIASALITTSGCGGSSCPPSERFVGGGTRHDSGDKLVWESTPPAGPFTPFEGATTVHFRHGLGARTYLTHVELSFTQFPESRGGGGATEAAGNQATKLLQSEDEFVVKNDTCANYYIRVVVEADRSDP